MFKKSQGNIIVCKVLQGIWFYTQRKDGENATSIWSSQRNCYSYIDSLQKQESNDCSSDGDTDFFDIVAGILPEDTILPYMFIISLDFEQW